LPKVPALPVGARLAFVSTATFAASSGTKCRRYDLRDRGPASGAVWDVPRDARDDGRDGRVEVRSRAKPWYRVDRIALAATTALVFDFSPLDVPLTVGAGGNRIAVHVWTGANDPKTLATLADDCNDWTSAATANMGHTGKSSSSSSGFDDGSVACDSALPVYCFQQ